MSFSLAGAGVEYRFEVDAGRFTVDVNELLTQTVGKLLGLGVGYHNGMGRAASSCLRKDGPELTSHICRACLFLKARFMKMAVLFRIRL